MRAYVFKRIFILLVLAGMAAACIATPVPVLPTPPPFATLTPRPTVTVVLPSPVPTDTPEPTATQASLFPPVTEADWQRGASNPTVTLVVYTDYQCPLCVEFAPALVQLLQEFPDDLLLVHRHFPLPQLDKSRLAVIAAEAAGRQGMFWPMHDLLFAEAKAWAVLPEPDFRARLAEYAGQLELDPSKFQADLADPALAELAEAAYQAAVDIPLPGAPFVLFNGAPLQDSSMMSHWALWTLIKLELLKERQYTSGPPEIIDPFKSYTATLRTEKGDIVIRLFAEQTPLTVNNFVFLAREGWYDGVTFHRVIPGFAAQTGDPSGTGYGGPGYFIPDEIVPSFKFDAAGLVGMANAGPSTNGSQFFISLAPLPELNGQYTLFGQVTQGLDVLNALTPRDPNNDAAAPPGDVIHTVIVEEQ